MKRIIALLLVLSTTLLFGCNIEFVDPNASADGSSGGSAIVTPNGGTTTKPNGGTTGGTTSGGSTTKPDSGTTSGGSTSKPDSGTSGSGSTTTPDSGTTSGGSMTTPDSGTSGGNTSGGSTSTPDSGTTGGNTSGGSSTTTPDSGTIGGNTSGGSSTTTPDSGTSGGGSTTIVPDDKPVTPPEPTSSTDINFVYPKLKAAFDAFSARSSYQTKMSGTTVAKNVYMVFTYKDVTQAISSNVEHANGLWQSYYKSTGYLDLYHYVYVSGGSVVYSERSDGSKKKNADIAEYRETFGVTPCDYQLGGYVVDLTTITGVSYKKDVSGKVTFVISVNGNMSSGMLLQMQKFGKLSTLPVFSKLTFTIVCENGTDISSYDTYAEYRIKTMGQEVDAVMNLSTTVSDYNGTITFPKV